MDIRLLIYCFNEIKMLPLKKKWCNYHGIRMVYFDNESTDGSREWAIKNGVFEEDIITDGEFHIVKILNKVEEYRRNNTYDWSVLNGADLFLSGFNGVRLCDYIKSIDDKGYDGIKTNYAMVCRNNDVSTLDFSYYSRCVDVRDNLTLIAKQENIINIDSVYSKNPFFDKKLWWFNMGNTKDKQERKDIVDRREKAWSKGLKRNYGNHYKDLQNYDYTLPNLITQSLEHVGAKDSLIELSELLN